MGDTQQKLIWEKPFFTFSKIVYRNDRTILFLRLNHREASKSFYNWQPGIRKIYENVASKTTGGELSQKSNPNLDVDSCFRYYRFVILCNISMTYQSHAEDRPISLGGSA